MNVTYKKKSCRRNDCDIFCVCSISRMNVYDEQFVYITQNFNEIRKTMEDLIGVKLYTGANLSQGFS